MLSMVFITEPQRCISYWPFMICCSSIFRVWIALTGSSPACRFTLWMESFPPFTTAMSSSSMYNTLLVCSITALWVRDILKNYWHFFFWWLLLCSFTSVMRWDRRDVSVISMTFNAGLIPEHWRLSPHLASEAKKYSKALPSPTELIALEQSGRLWLFFSWTPSFKRAKGSKIRGQGSEVACWGTKTIKMCSSLVPSLKFQM